MANTTATPKEQPGVYAQLAILEDRIGCLGEEFNLLRGQLDPFCVSVVKGESVNTAELSQSGSVIANRIKESTRVINELVDRVRFLRNEELEV
jgi:hypothetical protein